MIETRVPTKSYQISQIDFERLKLQLESNGFLKSTVVTGSMEPLIRTGEEILIEPIANLDQLKRFEVLVFWDGAILICHYYLGPSNFSRGVTPLILTKGLRGLGVDLPVPRERILGRVAKTMTPWQRFKQILSIWLRR